MGLLLKFILFAIVFYYIFRTIGGIVFRLMGGQRTRQAAAHSQYQQRRRDGEVHVETTSQRKRGRSNINSDDGDYIDFEEVK